MKNYDQILASKKKWRQIERNQTSKALREVHNALIHKDPPPSWLESNWQRLVMAIVLIIGIFLLFSNCSFAYTDYEIANAIRKSEGVWTYGIKTVACDSESSCRRICLNTIKNNRKRYSQYGYRNYPSFVQFLGSRYCPTTGRNLSKSEKSLNKNWVRNVQYHLKDGA